MCVCEFDSDLFLRNLTMYEKGLAKQREREKKLEMKGEKEERQNNNNAKCITSICIEIELKGFVHFLPFVLPRRFLLN